MLKFLRRNWFILSLTALAAIAAGVCVLFPPVLIAGLAIGLASAPAFAMLGSFAVPAAITTIAVTAAAAVYAVGGILHGAASFLNWAIHKCFGAKTDVKHSTHDGSDSDDYGSDFPDGDDGEDDNDAPYVTPRSEMGYVEEKTGEQPLDISTAGAVAVDGSSCCSLSHKGASGASTAAFGFWSKGAAAGIPAENEDIADEVSERMTATHGV